MKHSNGHAKAITTIVAGGATRFITEFSRSTIFTYFEKEEEILKIRLSKRGGN